MAKAPKPIVPEVAPASFFVMLEGRRGGELKGSVNGKLFTLPTGIEIEVDAQHYDAVKAYITQERN